MAPYVRERSVSLGFFAKCLLLVALSASLAGGTNADGVILARTLSHSLQLCKPPDRSWPPDDIWWLQLADEESACWQHSETVPVRPRWTTLSASCVWTRTVFGRPRPSGYRNVTLCSLGTSAVRYKRSTIDEAVESEQTDDRAVSVPDFRPAVITGLRVEEAGKAVSYDDDGASVVLAGTPVTVRLFGHEFSDSSQFRFVLGSRPRGAGCDDLPFSVSVNIDKASLTTYSTLVNFRLPSADQISDANVTAAETPAFYVCSLERRNGYNHWVHQGNEPGVKLRTFQRSLPLWIQFVFIAFLLTLSGLFSGLNLGLMALDRTDLKIYENTGSDKEKHYARAIIPVRNHGNYLLCTLLLGNVLVNSTLTILLDDLTSGVVAIVGSTLGIVIFGEIVPQAICSRFGLAIGANTIWITKFFMVLTLPVAYPISLVLNVILGEEIGAYYNRERLKELIKVTNEYHDLEKEEVNIISGALELRKKKVSEIMTRLEDIFMLSFDSVLDFDTVAEIMKQGYSRVPIYEGERYNIIGLLFIKDLALVDPEDATPLKALCRFHQNQCNFVFEDTTLDVVFKDFKEGLKGHMAFVVRINNEGDGDPFYETIGLVTLEDVIEELIQAEIVDESDVWMDNRSKRRRNGKGHAMQDFGSWAVQYREQAGHKLSPQLALAAFQFLSTTVEPFKPDWISENVLHRLIQQGMVVRYIRVKNKDKTETDLEAEFIYRQGRPADYFALILEGRVEVTIGRENLMFEGGPFTYFGSAALTFAAKPANTVGNSRSSIRVSRWSVRSGRAFSIAEGLADGGAQRWHPTFVTDYTVRAVTDVIYFRVSRSLYQAARSATLLEREIAQRSADLEAHLDQGSLAILSDSKEDVVELDRNPIVSKEESQSTVTSQLNHHQSNQVSKCE